MDYRGFGPPIDYYGGEFYEEGKKLSRPVTLRRRLIRLCDGRGIGPIDENWNPADRFELCHFVFPNVTLDSAYAQLERHLCDLDECPCSSERLQHAAQLVEAERDRQDAKWGPQNHEPSMWLSILMEEVGEVAKAIVEGDRDGYREEMVQVAAVAQAAIECECRPDEQEDTDE